MNILPAFASISNSNIVNLFTKSLPITTHHRFVSLIGDILPTTTADASAMATSVDPATTATSDSVPTHPNSALPIVLDTGVKYMVC